MKNLLTKRTLIIVTVFLAVVFLATFIILVLQNNSNGSKYIVKGGVQNSLTSLGFKPDQFSIGSTLVNANDSGIFETQLAPGDYTVTIKSEGYIDYSEKLSVKSNIEGLKILVLPENLATFKGKLLAQSGHNFTKDTLSISNASLKINNDGTFQGSIAEGTYNLAFESDNYKDIDSTVTFKKGENNLKDIQLIESGDVSGDLKSYLKEEIVSDLKIIVENTNENQIEIDYANNSFRIKDLDTLNMYSVRFRAPGYVEREYKITIKQGLNQIFDLKYVEDIPALYPKVASTREKPTLFISDLDGKNQVQISTDNTTNIVSRYLDHDSKTIYYQSANNSEIRDWNRKNVGLVYSYNIDNKETNLITTNTTGVGTLYPNFIAKKMFQYSYDGKTRTYTLQISDLSGDNKAVVYSGSSKILNYVISDDAKFAYFSLELDEQVVVYRYNIASDFYSEVFRGNEVKFYDVSHDGKKIIYYRKNISTNFYELVEFIADRNNHIIIEENFKGRFYQYLNNGKSTTIIYSIIVDSRENIFYYDTENNSKTRLISLASDLSTKGIYQESGIIYYLTNKGLYAVDFNKPFTNKLVSSEVYDYTK